MQLFVSVAKSCYLAVNAIKIESYDAKCRTKVKVIDYEEKPSCDPAEESQKGYHEGVNPNSGQPSSHR